MNDDRFAPRTHGDIWKARLVSMPLAEMGGLLLTAAETVMAMDETDPRRRYAQEYVGRMLDYVERQQEIATLEAATDGQPRSDIELGELYLNAATRMRSVYGDSGPNPTAGNFHDDYDPTVAFWSGEGIQVGNTVLTDAIIGPARPQA